MKRNRVSISLSFLASRFTYSIAIDTAASLYADLRTTTTTRQWEVDDRCTRRNLLGNDGKPPEESATFDDDLPVEGSRIASSAQRRRDSLGVDSISLSDMQESDSNNGLRLRGSQSSRTSEDKNYRADQRYLQEYFEQQLVDQLEINQEENNQHQLGNDQAGGNHLEENQGGDEWQEGDQSYQLEDGQLGGDPQERARPIQLFRPDGDQWEDHQQMDGDFFHLRQHWYPGACWQEEWREREWCMQCPGNQCDEGEWLWVEECAPIPTQRFQWVPNSNTNNNDSTSFSEGQLKMAAWDLCLQRTGTRYFDLEKCDASNQNQYFVRQSTDVIFELHPAHDTSMCVTQHHHPKDFEEIFAMSCSDARNSHTSFWDTNWQGEQDFNLLEHVNCTSSQPCGRCAGDCDDDSDCEEGLTCFFRDDNTPVPGCSGIGRFGADYCVIPPAGDHDDADETAVDVEEVNGQENVVSPNSTTAGMPDSTCTNASPCRICQGSCDSEDQCEGDLKCFQTLDSKAIGCLGQASIGFTYCMDPSNFDQGVIRDRQPGCTDESPCNECEGRCDSDSQCEGDLSCFFRDGDEEIPGCTGRGTTGREYCVNPSNLVRH